MILGAGVGTEPYYGTQALWADVMKSSRRGWTLCPNLKNLDTTFGQPFTTQALDSNGWPIGLSTVPSGQGLATFTHLNGLPITPGTYTLLWDGPGTIVVQSNHKNQWFTSSPASIQIDATNINGIKIAIAQSGSPGSSNYVKNIQLLLPGITEAEALANPFNPAFLAVLEPFQVIRVMDFMGLNKPNWNVGIDVPNVTSMDAQTQVATWGPNYDYALQLATLLGKDLWINMPVGSTVAYMDELASYVLSNLPAGNKVYLEYGNEVWNWSYHSAAQWVLDWANTQTPPVPWDLAWAILTNQCFEVWKSLDTDNQLVRVAAGQWTNISLLQVHLKQLAGLADPNDPNKGFDITSCAPYFGPSAAQIAGYTASTTTAQILADCRAALAGVVTGLAAWQAELLVVQKAIGRATPIPTITYEAGVGLVPSGITAPYYAAMLACQTDPGMQAITAAYLKAIDQGGCAGSLWTYGVFPAGPAGQWGLTQYTGEPSGQAPKMAAVLAYLGQPVPPP